ncbi:hypothetical protein F4824DRAFT_496825 [Ustulina deusta]|nr:hypothetical protein F4824DRAFT_496825 [Ustulina deusta]
MFHRRQHRRQHPHSRPPRANAQESHHTHRRTDGYEDSFPTTEDELRFARDSFDNEPLMWSSTSRVGDTATVPHSEDSVSDTSTSQDQTMESEWPAPGTSDYNETLSRDHSYSHLNFSDPAWGGSTVVYQHSPHDYLQDQISSVTPHPEDGVSAHFLGSAHSQTGPTSSEYHQPGEIWTASAPPRWAPRVDVPPNRTFRPSSMRAYQGSDVQLSGADPYDNAVIPVSMNQPDGIEENDSSGSNDRTTPVYRHQYVNSWMGGRDFPWSPEFPRRTPTINIHADATHEWQL